MSNEIPIPQGYIPDLPRNMSVGRDGALNFDMQLGLATLYQALQQLVTNQGVQPPRLTTDQQHNIRDFYTTFVGKQLPQNVPNIAGIIAIDYTSSVPIFFLMTFAPSTLFVQPGPDWHVFNFT